jgi:hypothetical protein
MLSPPGVGRNTNAPFTDITRIISGANNITDDDQQTFVSDSFVRTSNRLSIFQGHDFPLDGFQWFFWFIA